MGSWNVSNAVPKCLDEIYQRLVHHPVISVVVIVVPEVESVIVFEVGSQDFEKEGQQHNPDHQENGESGNLLNTQCKQLDKLSELPEYFHVK